ncbi:DUF4037 domain-containing protein [Candidatus Uhrbacteria bacterium]|nr:DUF4037 domain-containing protein [Candidatus Uhrbacteria bacterium]
MLQNFHKQNAKQIVKEAKEIFDTKFFIQYPEFKGRVDILIVGSVANGVHDKYSDVDIELLYRDVRIGDELLSSVKKFKKELSLIDAPVQIHRPKLLDAFVTDLDSWTRDGMLREFSNAKIVSDSTGDITRLQKMYKWYPKDVYKEKINWLFAEMMFEYHERHLVAVKRGDVYFANIVKNQILKYAMTVELMLNRKYPSFDKHLYGDFKSLKKLPRGLVAVISKCIRSTEFSNGQKDLEKIIFITEKLLISKKLINQESLQYWIELRPKYSVEV